MSAFTFNTRTGHLYQDEALIGTGYSGYGPGRLAPELESIRNIGPIPRGKWAICGPPLDTESHGPFVLSLLPMAGTETFQRSGFLIHGDSVRAPGTASYGCVVLANRLRRLIWDSGIRTLVVTSEPPTATPKEQP